MGYRIQYDGRIDKYEVVKWNPLRFHAMILGAFCLFLMGTFWFWPEGAETLRGLLIPGDDVVTVAAFRMMRDDLRNGSSIPDAVFSFCEYVIYGT